MKIRKIKFPNGGILGNLEFDFINPNSRKPYETIIFIGLNGVGKTSLLRNLSYFVTHFDYTYRDIQSVEYECQGNIFSTTSDGKEFIVTDSYGMQYSNIGPGYNPIKEELPESWRDRSSYFVESDLDHENLDAFENTLDKIKQIQNEELIQYAYNNIKHDDNPQKWSDFFKSSRINKLTKALNTFFDNKLRYFGFDPNGKISFKKNGEIVNYKNLSSGEKQITYKAVKFLLDNKEAPEILFFDEPESGLHPSWHSKILDFYKELATNLREDQEFQFFISTHSPYILSEYIQKPDVLIYRLYENNGVNHCEKIEKPQYLSTITQAEVSYHVFNLPSPDYHNQLFCEIQNRFSKTNVLDCDRFIESCPEFNAELHIRNSNHGKTEYHTICSFIRNNIDHYDNHNNYTKQQLVTSIELMQEILKNIPKP